MKEERAELSVSGQCLSTTHITAWEHNEHTNGFTASYCVFPAVDDAAQEGPLKDNTPRKLISGNNTQP